MRIDENEAAEFTSFAAAITSVEHTHDFVVIDTPGADTYLARLAHSMADTLVTPLNDSFVDFDVLARVDPQTYAVSDTSHYAEMVREARRQRRIVDGKMIDWVVVRNRLSMLGSRNKRLVGEGVNELARQLGFRFIDGFAERVVYREFFPRGLSALDDLDEETLGTRPSLTHVTARQEVEALLPRSSCRSTSAAGGASKRARNGATAEQPLDMHESWRIRLLDDISPGRRGIAPADSVSYL